MEELYTLPACIIVVLERRGEREKELLKDIGAFFKKVLTEKETIKIPGTVSVNCHLNRIWNHLDDWLAPGSA